MTDLTLEQIDFFQVACETIGPAHGEKARQVCALARKQLEAEAREEMPRICPECGITLVPCRIGPIPTTGGSGARGDPVRSFTEFADDVRAAPASPPQEDVEADDLMAGLKCIAWQLRADLEFHRKKRAKEGLSTDVDTSLIAPRYWHGHGQMEQWIRCFEASAATIQRLTNG